LTGLDRKEKEGQSWSNWCAITKPNTTLFSHNNSRQAHTNKWKDATTSLFLSKWGILYTERTD